MYVKLFTVWFLAVVAFFGLWALLAKVVKRISDKRHRDTDLPEGSMKEESAPENLPSED